MAWLVAHLATRLASNPGLLLCGRPGFEASYKSSLVRAYLLGELVEEEAGVVGNLLLLVLQAQGQLADLTFDLHHVVEDEVGEYYQRVLPHCRGVVSEAGGVGREGLSSLSNHKL